MSRIWSNPTWMFFHTFAEKVDINFYNRNKDICLMIIKSVCEVLPCMVCRVHATRYMRNITIKTVPTKRLFRKMLLDFHNFVNRRLRKRQYPERALVKYRNMKLASVLDLMCYEIKRYYVAPGPIRFSLTAPDFKVLDNIQLSIKKHMRFFS